MWPSRHRDVGKNTSALAYSTLSLMELSDGFVGVDVGKNEGPRIECAKCRVAVTEEKSA